MLELAPDFLLGHHPRGHARGGAAIAEEPKRRDDDVSSLVLRRAGDVDLDRIGGFVEELLATRGNDMLRYKGILSIQGKAERLIFQGVHRITGFDHGRPWQPEESRESVIVIIGRRLDAEAITAAFEAACMPDGALAPA